MDQEELRYNQAVASTYAVSIPVVIVRAINLVMILSGLSSKQGRRVISVEPQTKGNRADILVKTSAAPVQVIAQRCRDEQICGQRYRQADDSVYLAEMINHQ